MSRTFQRRVRALEARLTPNIEPPPWEAEGRRPFPNGEEILWHLTQGLTTLLQLLTELEESMRLPDDGLRWSRRPPFIVRDRADLDRAEALEWLLYNSGLVGRASTDAELRAWCAEAAADLAIEDSWCLLDQMVAWARERCVTGAFGSWGEPSPSSPHREAWELERERLQ